MTIDMTFLGLTGGKSSKKEKVWKKRNYPRSKHTKNRIPIYLIQNTQELSK